MSNISLYFVAVLCRIPFYKGSNYVLSYLFGHPHFGHKSKMQSITSGSIGIIENSL